MKKGLNFDGQTCSGLPLRSRLRVGEYTSSDQYVTDFRSKYDCEEENDLCGLARKNFLNSCYSKCNDLSCSKTCNEGDDAILIGWGHPVVGEAYKAAFHEAYGCAEYSLACDNYRWDFYNSCVSQCSDTGECSPYCNEGTKAILSEWGWEKMLI